ncbi:MAG: carbon-nitrogen hydrolase family protein [Proteocatella sp.]
MKIKLGLAQLNVLESKEQNIINAVASIEELAKKGADIVVLPEMFSCPYNTNLFEKYAESKGEYTYNKISECAKKNNVIIFAGSIPEREANKIYNTSFVFDREGKCIGFHRKAHLFDIDVKNGQYFKESDVLCAGEKATVIDTEYGKIGLAICYDFRFPELSRKMVLEGAKLIIVPGAFNMTTGPAHWEILFRQRAVDNQVYCIGVAPARDENASYISYANSIVTSPWGDILMRLGEKAESKLVEIDLDYIESIREQLPLLRHRREAIY